MRKFVSVLFAFALSVLFASSAIAVPGLDPDPRDGFEIIFEQKQPDGSRLRFDRVPFSPTHPGWDFGDREAYSCAFVEWIASRLGVTTPSELQGADAQVYFYVEFERIAGLEQQNGDPYLLTNDKGDGPEVSDGWDPGPGALQTGAACGEEGHAGIPFDGSDHFSHFHPGQPGGWHFLDPSGEEFASLDLTRDECSPFYYTPNFDASYAIGWWDEDGPTFDGHSTLPCGGGPGEPIAIAVVRVSHLAPGITACLDEDGGPVCQTAGGPAPEPEPSPTPKPEPTCEVNPKTGECVTPKG